MFTGCFLNSIQQYWSSQGSFLLKKSCSTIYTGHFTIKGIFFFIEPQHSTENIFLIKDIHYTFFLKVVKLKLCIWCPITSKYAMNCMSIPNLKTAKMLFPFFYTGSKSVIVLTPFLKKYICRCCFLETTEMFKNTFV